MKSKSESNITFHKRNFKLVRDGLVIIFSNSIHIHIHVCIYDWLIQVIYTTTFSCFVEWIKGVSCIDQVNDEKAPSQRIIYEISTHYWTTFFFLIMHFDDSKTPYPFNLPAEVRATEWYDGLCWSTISLFGTWNFIYMQVR